MSLEKDQFGIEDILESNNPRSIKEGEGVRWTKDNVYYEVNSVDKKKRQPFGYQAKKIQRKKLVFLN